MHHLPSRYIPCDGRLTASAYFNHAPRMGSDNRPPYYALYYIIFQSTLPAGGATEIYAQGTDKDDISIHAPRRGSDLANIITGEILENFNPRSPQGERQSLRVNATHSCLFQSTLPAGGATHVRNDQSQLIEFQSTLPAGGATIHNVLIREFLIFQSTLPAGGATESRDAMRFDMRISIHAPRRGSDLVFGSFELHLHNFNPRSPQGERQLDTPRGHSGT